MRLRGHLVQLHEPKEVCSFADVLVRLRAPKKVSSFSDVDPNIYLVFFVFQRLHRRVFIDEMDVF